MIYIYTGYCLFIFYLFYYRNMKRPVTFWYTKDQPIFENTDDMPDTKIDVTRILGMYLYL